VRISAALLAIGVALNAKSVDLLLRNTTWTLSREVLLRVSLGAFMRYGVPITAVQLVAGALYVLALAWLVR
jgi:hypothetical protein